MTWRPGKSSAQGGSWDSGKCLFGKTELLHGGASIKPPPFCPPLGHFRLCSCFSLGICKIKEISGLKWFCISQCWADYHEINYCKHKVNTAAMETKNLPKIAKGMICTDQKQFTLPSFRIANDIWELFFPSQPAWQRFAELKTFGRAEKLFLLQFTCQAYCFEVQGGSQQVGEQDPGAAPRKHQRWGTGVFPCTYLISITQTKGQELRVGLPGWATQKHCTARGRCLGCNLFRELPGKMSWQTGGASGHGRAGRGQLPVCRSPVPGTLSFISWATNSLGHMFWI